MKDKTTEQMIREYLEAQARKTVKFQGAEFEFNGSLWVPKLPPWVPKGPMGGPQFYTLLPPYEPIKYDHYAPSVYPSSQLEHYKMNPAEFAKMVAGDLPTHKISGKTAIERILFPSAYSTLIEDWDGVTLERSWGEKWRRARPI